MPILWSGKQLFLEFYRQLFDSVKNSSYPGSIPKGRYAPASTFTTQKELKYWVQKLIDGEKNNIRFLSNVEIRKYEDVRIKKKSAKSYPFTLPHNRSGNIEQINF